MSRRLWLRSVSRSSRTSAINNNLGNLKFINRPFPSTLSASEKKKESKWYWKQKKNRATLRLWIWIAPIGPPEPSIWSLKVQEVLAAQTVRNQKLMVHRFPCLTSSLLLRSYSLTKFYPTQEVDKMPGPISWANNLNSFFLLSMFFLLLLLGGAIGNRGFDR